MAMTFRIFASLCSFAFAAFSLPLSAQGERDCKITSYTSNRHPLAKEHFIELPLGCISAEGWLKDVLISQKDGLTGHLDEVYPEVVGERNGWLGGDGDQWERGPYWIDGLLPLAYILKDKELIEKTRPWIEWILSSQKEDGSFGPDKNYPYEKGLQRNNCQDWWPRMVALKILQQYWSATKDERVIPFMEKYFLYQLKELPKKPLDNWTFWARYRGGDNLMSVYWLYNLTGNKKLLELGELLYNQSEPFTDIFLKRERVRKVGGMHSVNLAQGLKIPIIYYQAHPEQKYLDAMNYALDDIMHYHGYPNGMFSGDETIHGNDPTQGIELCTIVEFMFSLEQMYKITGNRHFAEQLEKIAYNALPAQTNEDYTARQYFQQVNQIELEACTKNFDTNHNGLDACFGLLTGFPCCTCNMHQGWPKYAQNLWYATGNGGVAVSLYAPSSVQMQVGGGVNISISEKTMYPFSDNVLFTIENIDKQVVFPFSFRIPSWSEHTRIEVNGVEIPFYADNNGMATIERKWKKKDQIKIGFSPKIKLSVWKENSRSVERGPLVYALNLEANEQKHDPLSNNPFDIYYTYTSSSPWNYALIDVPKDKLQTAYNFELNEAYTHKPWETSPCKITTKGRRIITWKKYNGMAGPLPYSIGLNPELSEKEEVIELIPYGCTTLRVAQFPYIGRHKSE